MAELRAPLLRRFSRFQVDTRILTRVRGKECVPVNGGEILTTLTGFRFVSVVLTCSTGRAAPGCCARPELRFQSFQGKKGDNVEALHLRSGAGKLKPEVSLSCTDSVPESAGVTKASHFNYALTKLRGSLTILS